VTTLRDAIAADISGGDVFYDTHSGHAELITYALGTDFIGVWDQDYIELDADGYARVSGTAPACWCRTSDAPARGQTIRRASTNYIIVEHQPNDDGETLLILREA